MTEYFRAVINGDAQDCARLTQELRLNKWKLFIDDEGYLVVSDLEWDKLEQLARTYNCELESLGQAQLAA